MKHFIPDFDPDSFRLSIDIVAIRDAKNWSQGQMADQMGCHQSKISRWESGLSVIDKLAAKEYWRLHHELGLHEKQPAGCGAENHGEPVQ